MTATLSIFTGMSTWLKKRPRRDFRLTFKYRVHFKIFEGNDQNINFYFWRTYFVYFVMYPHRCSKLADIFSYVLRHHNTLQKNLQVIWLIKRVLNIACQTAVNYKCSKKNNKYLTFFYFYFWRNQIIYFVMYLHRCSKLADIFSYVLRHHKTLQKKCTSHLTYSK